MALVEFSLVLVVLTVLLFGMLDFGKAFNYWIDETHLANKGARFAAVNKNPGSGPSLQDWIKEGANTTELRDALSVCIDFPNGTSNVGDPVRVRVTSTYTWMPLLDMLPNPELTGSATMRLEARPTNFSAGCST